MALPKNEEIVRFCNWWMGVALTPEWKEKKEEFLALCEEMNREKPKNRPYQVVIVGPEIILPKKGEKKFPEPRFGDDFTSYIRFLPAVAKFDKRYRCVGVFKY
jgi:hypothetical protein